MIAPEKDEVPPVRLVFEGKSHDNGLPSGREELALAFVGLVIVLAVLLFSGGGRIFEAVCS